MSTRPTVHYRRLCKPCDVGKECLLRQSRLMTTSQLLLGKIKIPSAAAADQLSAFMNCSSNTSMHHSSSHMTSELTNSKHQFDCMCMCKHSHVQIRVVMPTCQSSCKCALRCAIRNIYGQWHLLFNARLAT